MTVHALAAPTFHIPRVTPHQKPILLSSEDPHINNDVAPRLEQGTHSHADSSTSFFCLTMRFTAAMSAPRQWRTERPTTTPTENSSAMTLPSAPRLRAGSLLYTSVSHRRNLSPHQRRTTSGSARSLMSKRARYSLHRTSATSTRHALLPNDS